MGGTTLAGATAGVSAILAPWPPAALFVLRHALFLGPLALAALLMWRARNDKRALVGAIFAFLYGLPMVFAGHVAATGFGAWRYGGETLMLLGVPIDIMFGGALLWGPVVFLAAPPMRPWLAPALFVAINGLLLPCLTPFVTPGRCWFVFVLAIFAVCHLPALYLAQWTWLDIHLPRRCFLLAAAFAPLAFFLIPTLIVRVVGGPGWETLPERGLLALALGGLGLGFVAILGWSGVQMFAVYGEGTPIPLDPTKRLTSAGGYGFLRNPMQTSTALGFLILGALLRNPWVALGAVMTFAFVLGLVRWHHRNDLGRRFPQAWPLYQAHVPEWAPRWRAWRPKLGRLDFDDGDSAQRLALRLLRAAAPLDLDIHKRRGALRYEIEDREVSGVCAFAMALSHTPFPLAMIGAALMLVAAPLQAARRSLTEEKRGTCSA
jgi:protein-S-isoprenylcysteine O-methyltransferase Ste14